MKLLAIDTSTDYLTVAVTDGEKIIVRLNRKAPRSHSSLLMSAIDSSLRKARLKLKDIDGFCVGVGPGSFTGLRIGVTTVKGLAFTTDKPIVAVPTFDAIAQNAKKIRGIVCVVLDARKNKVYGCFYRSDGAGNVKKISRYLLLPAEELAKLFERHDTVYCIGDYAERIVPLYSKASSGAVKWHPRADSIAKLGYGLFRKKKFVSAEKLEPMYIYSKECDIKGY